MPPFQTGTSIGDIGVEGGSAPDSGTNNVTAVILQQNINMEVMNFVPPTPINPENYQCQIFK